MSRDKWISVAIYGPFLSGLLFFYINYLYIRYDASPEVELPTPAYEIKFSLCKRACDSIKVQRCAEWSDLFQSNICEYSCDAYIEDDATNLSLDWTNTFKCAEKASSAIELHRCGLNCNVMDEI